jgi:hypothetical protein
VPLSVHQVIDDKRTIGLREKFAETDGARRCVASVKVARAFFKLVILNRRALREMATQLLALGYILARLVSQNWFAEKFRQRLCELWLVYLQRSSSLREQAEAPRVWLASASTPGTGAIARLRFEM